jgi:hypothetical protein
MNSGKAACEKERRVDVVRNRIIGVEPSGSPSRELVS